MDIKLDIAFQEAMEEISELNKRIVMQRCIIKQLEEEIKKIKEGKQESEE